MEKKFFYAQVPPVRCGGALDHPWDYTVPAFRMAPHVWSVGQQDDVSVYLLDSGEGLILIDTGYAQTLYLTIDGIHRAGYDPRDIKMILLSHWHGDHVNGARYIQEMSQAEIWLSREDEEQHQLHKDSTFPLPTIPYTVDHFYDNSKPIELGRFQIHTKLTPGHTHGATTFFFEDRDDETGEVFRCAMHGGLGAPQLKPENLEKHGLTREMVYRFIADCEEMADWKVDITLPSHLNQGNIVPNIPKDPRDYRGFIAGYAWHDILLDRAEFLKGYYPEYSGKSSRRCRQETEK